MALLSLTTHRVRRERLEGRYWQVVGVSGVLLLDPPKRSRVEVIWLSTTAFLAETKTVPRQLPTKIPKRSRGEDWTAAARRVAADKGVAIFAAAYPRGVSIGSHTWLFAGNAYTTEDQLLTPEDVRALVNEQTNRRRLHLEKAHSIQAMTDQLDRKGRREPIPQDVKVTVWQRDGGRCVECGEQRDLEFDHIIPLARGGANTMRNLQLLCAGCNRRKGATLG